MSKPENNSSESASDAIAAVAIITIVVAALTFWLAGMPT